MTQPTADVLLRIERLLRIGKQEEAQALLVEYLRVNPSSARAWWLMSLTLPDITQQQDCLERVLHLDPEDELARERLEMLKNQPIPPPSVKPFTVLDLSDINELSAGTPPAPDRTAPGEAVPESDRNGSTSEPAPAMPDWAAGSEAVPEGDRSAPPSEPGQALPVWAAGSEPIPESERSASTTEPGQAVPEWVASSAAVPESERSASTIEPGQAIPEWATPSGVISESNEQASVPGSPPLEPVSLVPIPDRSKNKWWVLDILMAILAVILIVILAGFIMKQQQTQLKTKQEINFQQQTLEVAQTMASMPLPTLSPTWTSSPTGTALPTATFSATPTLTPTPRNTLTRTPPPSGLVGPIAGLFAPDFNLTDQVTGQKVMFNQFDGQPALIFFFSTSCTMCSKEIPAVESIYQTYKGHGLVLLAIDSGDSAATVEAYRSANQLTFPILLDPVSTALSTYQVDTLPRHFFVNTDGRITYVGMGEMTPDELNTQVGVILQQPPTATP
jgi:peroxiredoxin